MSLHSDDGIQETNTPGLHGAFLFAPYLHDGRAATLRDVLTMPDTLPMGHAHTLSDSELDDLLRTSAASRDWKGQRPMASPRMTIAEWRRLSVFAIGAGLLASVACSATPSLDSSRDAEAEAAPTDVDSASSLRRTRGSASPAPTSSRAIRRAGRTIDAPTAATPKPRPTHRGSSTRSPTASTRIARAPTPGRALPRARRRAQSATRWRRR